MLRTLGLLALLLAAYVAAVVVVNRKGAPAELEAVGPIAAMPTRPAGSIEIMTWNLGYGGLGAASEFYADGGKKMLPPSRAAVESNVAGIVRELARRSPDVILMQETARPSLLTRGVDTLGAVEEALRGRDNAFSGDIVSSWLPPPLALKNGLFTSVGWGGAKRELYELPREPGHILGYIKRRYHAQIIRLPTDGGEDWVIIDIHLSAFDEGANTRLEQLRAVLQLAEQEYAKGHRVIVGGDWNYEFANPGRPTTTGKEFLFWLHTFPFEELNDGWTPAFDPVTPTCRTNERPYVKGENFTTVIDGFVVSPNVRADAVAAIDLDFQYTDHQPVIARFRAK
jgi:exonuclease III